MYDRRSLVRYDSVGVTMPGLQETYIIKGKRGRRRTPYHPLCVREHTWYDAHRLADHFKISIVDLLDVMMKTNIEAIGREPTTAASLKALSEHGRN